MGTLKKSRIALLVTNGTLLLAISILLLSCTASVSVKPDPPSPNITTPIVVFGNVHYDGNPKYIPTTIAHKTDTDVSIKYEYVVSYAGTGQKELISAFLPTTLLGVPTGADDVSAAGKLEISKNNTVVKTYFSEASVFKPRSLFAGGVDKTELRAMALKSIKENIEMQMNNDSLFLSQF